MGDAKKSVEEKTDEVVVKTEEKERKTEEVGKDGEEGRELHRCYAKSCLSLHANSSSSSSISSLPPEQEEPPAVRRPVLPAPTPSGPTPTPPTNPSEPSQNRGGRSLLRCPSRSALSAVPTSDTTAPFHNPNTSHPDDTATRAVRNTLPITTKDPNENEGRELGRCPSRSALSDIPLNDAPQQPNSALNPDTPDTDDTATRAVRTTLPRPTTTAKEGSWPNQGRPLVRVPSRSVLSIIPQSEASAPPSQNQNADNDDTATRAVRTTLPRPTAAPKEDSDSNRGRPLVRVPSRSVLSIIPQSEASVPPSQNQKADTDDTATRAVRTILPTPATNTTQADGDNRGRVLYRCPSKSAPSPLPVSTDDNAARAGQPTPDRSNTNNPKSKPNPSPKPNTPNAKPNNTSKPNKSPKPNNTPNSKPSN